MLCTATPDHSSSSENINNTPGFPDYLSVSYDYTKTYCKVSHILKSVTVIRKSDRKLLQSVTENYYKVLKEVFTKCDNYYQISPNRQFYLENKIEEDWQFFFFL